MTLVDVTSWIQYILAPVVMVTTCAILLRGLYTHYAAVTDRMRLMARERLTLIWQTEQFDARQPPPTATLVAERIGEIDRQLPGLLNRHLLIRDVIVEVYLAILFYLATMFSIALAVASRSPLIATITLATFLVGTAILFVAMILIAWEIWISHRAVDFEVNRVLGISAEDLGKR